MKAFNPYITFAGNCKEALEFYKKIFKGTIQPPMYYKDSPMDVPADYKNKIMHTDFVASKLHFMAADSMPGQSVPQGSNISLYLEFADTKEQTTIYKKLSEGGQILIPLAEQFWGARFGMIVDKFGVSWMVDYVIKKPAVKKKSVKKTK